MSERRSSAPLANGAEPGSLNSQWRTDGAGTVTNSYPTPPSLSGLVVGCQAAMFHPEQGIQLTNAVEVYLM